MTESQDAFLQLRKILQAQAYQFVTVTPESHRRYLEKNIDVPANETSVWSDFFGWSRQVPARLVGENILGLLRIAGAVDEEDGMVKSRVRFSSLDGELYMHSAFPTLGNDAVFFGPDTYRYLKFIKGKVTTAQVVLDIGCGSGAGGLGLASHLATRLAKPLEKLWLTDINPVALEYAKINSLSLENNLPSVEIFESDLLKNVRPGVDTIIANPPYIIDAEKRAYRHGGDLYGARFSLDIVKAALEYLPMGGQLALYTGVSVVKGKDIFLRELTPLLAPLLAAKKINFSYEELDPDVFGEELDLPAYRDVDRIAAVGLHITKI